MKIKVVDLYKYSKSQSLPLLGSASYDFWTPYTASYDIFDRYFRNRFKSWVYFETFAEGEETEDLYTDWTETIAAHLAINSKRYSELYRVQILTDDAYDIVNNYDLHETHQNTRSESGTSVEGAREDRTSGSTTEGEREDSTSASTIDGARTDSGSTVNGAQTTTTTGSIQGFNSSAFSDADKQVAATNSFTDTTSVTKGAQNNSSSSTSTKGEQTNSNSSTLNKGIQNNSHSTSGTENITIRRYGNIGVQTPADVIGGHIELWERLFNFYKLIFDEIAKDYLLIDDYYSDNPGSFTSATENTIKSDLKLIKSQLAALVTTSHLDAQVGAIREDVADVHTKITEAEDGLTDLITNMQ